MSSALADTSKESSVKTIGKTPLPCLPVDSAISCSTQSPKPITDVPSGTKPSLSLKLLAPAVLARAAPSTRPGFESRSCESDFEAAMALFRKAATSTPAKAVGTTPKAVSAE